MVVETLVIENIEIPTPGESQSWFKNTSYSELSYDEPEIQEANNPTKYSEEIFEKNYSQARVFVKQYKQFNNLTNFALSSLYWDDENQKTISMRDLKGVQRKINAEKRSIDWDLRHDIITEERAKELKIALNAVQKTLNTMSHWV